MNWIALILSLTILVASHELGHLLFAKLFHTRVRRYYIFFNWKFSLIKAKKFDGKWHFAFFNAKTPESWDEKNLCPKDQDNTLWGLGWIPLGGYCDIAGMIDETKDASDLEAEPQPWEYRTKPAWQRLFIISGGVLVNFITALLLTTVILAHWGEDEVPMHAATFGYQYHEVLLDEGFRHGDIIQAIDGRPIDEFSAVNKALLLDNPKEVTVLRADSLVTLSMSGNLVAQISDRQVKSLMAPRMPFVIDKVVSGTPAAKAGLMANDSLVSINGLPLPVYYDFTDKLHQLADQPATIGFYRNGNLDSVSLTVSESGTIGVVASTDLHRFFPGIRHIDYTLLEAIPTGISRGWGTLTAYVSSLKLLFTPSGAKSLGGFGSMASLFPEYWSWQAFWSLTALLAIILAFMNVIPIPGLDGGHILFTLWEMVSRRKPSDKFLTYAQNVGMALLLLLMVWANGNDLWRWLSQYF